VIVKGKKTSFLYTATTISQRDLRAMHERQKNGYQSRSQGQKNLGMHQSAKAQKVALSII
jgi:hypothetical protein